MFAEQEIGLPQHMRNNIIQLRLILVNAVRVPKLLHILWSKRHVGRVGFVIIKDDHSLEGFHALFRDSVRNRKHVALIQLMLTD